MRFITTAAVAALLVFPLAAGFAQTTTAPGAAAPAPAAPAPAAPAPAQAAPSGSETGAAPSGSSTPSTTTKRTKHARQTLQSRFSAANKAKDGHLTLDEAKGAKWSYVERHFDAIDKDHKGYVTMADIQAYSRSRHRHSSTPKSSTASAPAASAPAAPAPTSPAPASGGGSTPE